MCIFTLKKTFPWPVSQKGKHDPPSSLVKHRPSISHNVRNVMSLHSRGLCLSRYAECNVSWSKRITCGLTWNLQSEWSGWGKIFLSLPQSSSTQMRILKPQTVRLNWTHKFSSAIFFRRKPKTTTTITTKKNTFRMENLGAGGGKRQVHWENQRLASPVRLLSVSLYASLERQCAWSCVPPSQNKNTHCSQFHCLILLHVATGNLSGRILLGATTWIKLCNVEHAGAYRSEWACEDPPCS